MTDHLDPDVLAYADAAVARGRLERYSEVYCPTETLAALLAVARDHARLTDQLAAERDNADREIARLKAENADLQTAWALWRRSQKWDAAPIYLAAKVAEEAGEVLGATLKLGQHGGAGTHPDHDEEHLAVEIGQLMGTIFCLAEFFGIDPTEEAGKELDRVRVRYPVEDTDD